MTSSIFKRLDEELSKVVNPKSIKLSSKLMRDFKIACRNIEGAITSEDCEWCITTDNGTKHVAYKYIPLISDSSLNVETIYVS